jgi:hypothetical protein
MWDSAFALFLFTQMTLPRMLNVHHSTKTNQQFWWEFKPLRNPGITSEDDLYRKCQNNSRNFEKAYIKLANTSNKLMKSNLSLGKEYLRAYDEISKSIYLSKQKSRSIINGNG